MEPKNDVCRAGTGACGAVAPQDDFCPLISVVIPAYNAGKWMAECVGSVVAQTYSHWECIVVDDGSTDNTRAEAERMKDACGDRLTIIGKPNGGAASARNVGLAAAKGDYVVFVDADDLMLPQELEFAWRAVRENPDALVIWDYAHEVPREEPVWAPRVLDRVETMVTFQFCGSWISPVNKLFQKRVLDTMTPWFDEEKFPRGTVGEDADFVERYTDAHWKLAGACCCYLQIPLYLNRIVNENSICAVYGRNNAAMQDARKEDPPVSGYLAKAVEEVKGVQRAGSLEREPEMARQIAQHYLSIFSYGVYSARSLGEAVSAGFWNCTEVTALLAVCKKEKIAPLYYLLFRARAAALITRVYVAKCRRSALYYRLDKLAHLMLPGWK